MSPSTVTSPSPAVAVRGRRGRRTTVLVLLTLVVLAALVLSLSVGSRSIGPDEVLGALLGRDHSPDATVVTTQRLPRTWLGLAVGVALGVAGALMQGHTRNPMADPGLFGVNAGATFAVSLLVFVTGQATPTAVVLCALAGAGAVSVVVFLAGLHGVRGGTLVVLAIVGTTVSAMLASLSQALQLMDRDTLDRLRYWEVGSVAGRDYALAPWVMPLILLGLVLAMVNAFAVDALGLGDDVATSLGHDVRRARITGILAITVLAGSATAICGPIAFLGLVAPHGVRALVGPDYRWLVPLSGLAGGALLLLSDTLGRVVAFTGELQASIVMAALGAPVLLLITRRRRLVSL